MSVIQRVQALAAGRTLVALAAFALVVAIGWTLAALTWLLVDGVPGHDATGLPMPASSAPRTRALTPEMAAGWTLFGVAAAPEAATGAAEEVPQTSLALQLLGIFSAADAKLAGAVIAERGKEGELFRVGATLPGGATLEKVEKTQVLLRRRGQLETLRFEELSASTGIVGAFAAARDDSDPVMHAHRAAQVSVLDGSVDKNELVNRFVEDFKAAPEVVLTDIGLAPARGGGYSVGEGAHAELLRKLGLRPGDVVLSVNGKALGNAQADASLVEQVKASGEARVEVRRGSQTFTVSYPL